jgi:hypothetical protein
VAITYFNWNEIFLLSKRDLAAIIILTYAQTKQYNELSAKTLMYRLRLNHIPPFLFHDGLLTQYKHTLYCNYKTRDAQSYFLNSSFLFMGISARQKAVYLKALSMRRISDNKDYIPLRYFSNITYNPLVSVEEDKIHFTLESSVRGTPT